MSEERLTQVAVVEKEIHLLAPGEMSRHENGHWYLGCPNCGHPANLSTHYVRKHQDGTMSVTPSILHYGPNLEPCAHFWVNRSQIQWC
jgi:hypothetical protein